MREGSLLATTRTKYDYRSVLFILFLASFSLALLMCLGLCGARTIYTLTSRGSDCVCCEQWPDRSGVCPQCAERTETHDSLAPVLPFSTPSEPGRTDGYYSASIRVLSLSLPLYSPSTLIAVAVTAIIVYFLSLRVQCTQHTLLVFPGFIFFFPLFFYFTLPLGYRLPTIPPPPPFVFHLVHVERAARTSSTCNKNAKDLVVFHNDTNHDEKEDVVSFHCSKSNRYVTLCYVTRGTSVSTVHWSYYFSSCMFSFSTLLQPLHRQNRFPFSKVNFKSFQRWLTLTFSYFFAACQKWCNVHSISLSLSLHFFSQFTPFKSYRRHFVHSVNNLFCQWNPFQSSCRAFQIFTDSFCRFAFWRIWLTVQFYLYFLRQHSISPSCMMLRWRNRSTFLVLLSLLILMRLFGPFHVQPEICSVSSHLVRRIAKTNVPPNFTPAAKSNYKTIQTVAAKHEQISLHFLSFARGWNCSRPDSF